MKGKAQDEALAPPAPDGDEPTGPLYRGLFEHALIEVHIWKVVRDSDGTITTWRLVDANARALRSWGKALDDIVGKTTEEIFPGATPTDTFMPIVSKIISTGKPHEWEVSFDGTGQVLHMISYPVGEYFVSTGTDVSRYRESERKLNEALESLRQAVRDGGVGLWDWDLKTDQVHYSDEWKRQLGHDPDEVVSDFEEWRSRVHPDDLEKTLAQVEHNIATGSLRGETQFRMRHKDGSYRWILAHSSLAFDADRKPIRMRGSHIDITRVKQLEDRVQAFQKLEAVGTLAAGVAHDFNNLLTAITGNLSLLSDSTISKSEHAQILADVDIAAQQAKDLTAQLLTFAKGGAPIREAAAIRDLISDTARFATRGSSVSCELELDKDLANVDADVGQLSQVINNLVINAKQAMPDGGIIRIRATNVSMALGNSLALDAGDYVVISMSDSGPGIPAELQSRVFDPFFSTKPGGSGLGLSSSYSIVAAHGGRLLLESLPGHGATFLIYLPATSASASTKGDPLQEQAGSGRVLVMDDNKGVRTTMERMLARLGYGCDAVSDGDQALARYAQAMKSGQPYSAVILDLTIPGQAGGKQVVGKLRALDPTVVALVASGYAEDDVMASYADHGFQGRLRKPFGVKALGTELSRVLSRTKRG